MRIKKIVLIILMTAISSFILNESLIYSQNNFFKSQNWHSLKQNFLTPQNAIESLASRTIVAGNRFLANLNVGHQFIVSNTPTDLDELTYEFKIRPNGYLDIAFNLDSHVFDGVRISRSAIYPNSYFQSDLNGKFITSKPFGLPAFGDEAHTATLKNSNGKIVLFFDGKKVLIINKPFEKKLFGFHSSLQRLEIISVKSVDKNKKRTDMLFSSPDNHLNFYPKIFLITFFFVIIISSAIFIFQAKSLIDLMTKISLFVMIASAFWFCFDYFYYSKVPKLWNSSTFTYSSSAKPVLMDLEQFRYLLLRESYALLGGEILTRVNLDKKGVNFFHYLTPRFCGETCSYLNMRHGFSPKKPGTKRLLFIGASFSNNVGVTAIENSFFDIFSNNIINNFKKKNIPFETLNLSSGISLEEKIDDLKIQIENFEPDAVVLSYYVAIKPDQIQSQKLIDFLKAKHIVIFYMTPVPNPEILNQPADRIQPPKGHGTDEENFVDEMTESNQIYLFPHRWLGEKTKFHSRGILWWDGHHMTPYGQELVATKLSSYVNKILNVIITK